MLGWERGTQQGGGGVSEQDWAGKGLSGSGLGFARLRRLCCAVLCCAVLCCAVLCCAVLCCAVPRRAVLCCAALCCAALPFLHLPCCALANGLSWCCINTHHPPHFVNTGRLTDIQNRCTVAVPTWWVVAVYKEVGRGCLQQVS